MRALTAFPLPSSGKLLVAAKSPLTGGYGDGNLGTHATVQMRRAGYDAIVIKGKALKPTILNVYNDTTEFVDARDYWGIGSFQTESRLKKEYGTSVGVVTIGQAGETLVKFANVVSQEGRAGGRPGMGAVMGSKNLKAVVARAQKLICSMAGYILRLFCEDNLSTRAHEVEGGREEYHKIIFCKVM